jgi:hypothetical protein
MSVTEEHTHSISDPQANPQVAVGIPDFLKVEFAQGKRLFHPLSNAFPLMMGAQFDELVADIKANGLREPITLYQDMILDGRNRYRGCPNAKIEPRFEQFEGDETAAAAFVISRNIHRRHLTPKDKRDAIAKLLKLQPQKSDRSIAKQIGVHNETVGAVRASLEARDGIRHVEKRTDSKGREQPARKASPQKPVKANAKTVEGTNEAKAKAQQDVGENSAGENARLQTRIDDLSAEKRRLEIKCTGLESEVEELKATPAKLEPSVASSKTLTQILRRALTPLLTSNPDAKEAGVRLKKFAEQMRRAHIGLDDVVVTTAAAEDARVK